MTPLCLTRSQRIIEYGSLPEEIIEWVLSEQTRKIILSQFDENTQIRISNLHGVIYPIGRGLIPLSSPRLAFATPDWRELRISSSPRSQGTP